MRLIGATPVRNAADVVEAFVRHNLTLLDGIAIVDHGSFDGTSDILAALVREGLPVFVARDDTPAFDQPAIMNRLVRHVFNTSDADWVFPIDSDEFLKVRSRQTLEDTLRAVPPHSHLLVPWLTYVPRFDATDDMAIVLRGARRLVHERHGLRKVVIGRHFMENAAATVSKGNHGVDRGSPLPHANPDLKCAAEVVALAHVPVRSAPQFVAKIASGWLATVAAESLRGGESFHWREAFAYLRSGRPLTPGQLTAFALNYSIAQDRWLPSDAIETIDDPFFADCGADACALRHPRSTRAGACSSRAPAHQEVIRCVSSGCRPQ
jgi:Glycosyl transferase family 2